MKKIVFLTPFFSLAMVQEMKPMKCSEPRPGVKHQIFVRTLDINKDLDIYLAHPQFCGKRTKDLTKPNYICASGVIKAGKPNGYNAITRQPVAGIGLTAEKGFLRALFARSYEVYVWDNTNKQMYVQKYIRPGCTLTFPDDFQKIGSQK